MKSIKLVLASTLVACGGAEKAVLPSSPIEAGEPAIKMQWTDCEGTCPVYRIEMFSDGDVVFYGISNVRALGLRRLHVDSLAIEQIEEALRRGGFFELSEDDHAPLTDAPKMIVTVTRGSSVKTVRRRDGTFGLPLVLVKFQAQLGKILPMTTWVGPHS